MLDDLVSSAFRQLLHPSEEEIEQCQYQPLPIVLQVICVQKQQIEKGDQLPVLLVVLFLEEVRHHHILLQPEALKEL